MTTIEQIARTIDRNIEREWDENPIALFESSHRLYGAHADGLSLLATGDDPYELLANPRPNDLVGAGIVTVGWATPVDDTGDVTGEPQRVRLVACYNGNEWAIIMRLAGEEGEPEVISNAGEGTFPEAISLWWHVSGMFGS